MSFKCECLKIDTDHICRVVKIRESKHSGVTLALPQQSCGVVVVLVIYKGCPSRQK